MKPWWFTHSHTHIHTQNVFAYVCGCGCRYIIACMLFFSLTSHILISSVFRASAITLASLNFIAVFSSSSSSLPSNHCRSYSIYLHFFMAVFLILHTRKNFLFSRKHFPSQNWCFIKRRNNTLTAFSLQTFRQKCRAIKVLFGVFFHRSFLCCYFCFLLGDFQLLDIECPILTIHMDAKWVFSFNNEWIKQRAYFYNVILTHSLTQGISQYRSTQHEMTFSSTKL